MANEGTDRLRGAAPAYEDIEAKRARAGVAAALFARGASSDGSESSFERVAVGRYEIASRLGAGGMGVVYRAHDPDLDRPVAVKLLHADSAADDKARARMLREARSLAKLSHPNVITVYDVGTEGGQVFVAMELVAGSDLRRWLERRREASWREILALFIAAGRGLEAAHEVALVHRDFKPENVLVGDDGRVRVLDFGLARAHQAVESPTDAGVNQAPAAGLQRTVGEGGARGEGGASLATIAHLPTAALTGGLTETGAMIGTPLYMAPELYAGKPADARSDQFAFCASLYEGIYRELPFGSGSRNLSTHVEAVAAGRVVEPPASSPVPIAVWGIIARGLDPDPLNRHRDMGSLLAALEGLGHEPAAPLGGRRSRWLWLTVVGVLALLGVLGVVGIALGWFAGTGDPAPRPPAVDTTRSDFAAPVEAPVTPAAQGDGRAAVVVPVVLDAPAPAPSTKAAEDQAPEQPDEPPAAARTKLELHGWCHLHEDAYTLIERSAARHAHFVQRGQCYVCRDERRASRTRNFSPRDCARYLLCGPAPAKECE